MKGTPFSDGPGAWILCGLLACSFLALWGVLFVTTGLSVLTMCHFAEPYPEEVAWQETYDALHTPEIYPLFDTVLRYGPSASLMLLWYTFLFCCVELFCCTEAGSQRPWSTRRWIHLGLALALGLWWVVGVL